MEISPQVKKIIIISAIALVGLAMVSSIVIVGRTFLSKAAPTQESPTPVIRIPPPTSEKVASPTAISQITVTPTPPPAPTTVPVQQSTTSTGWTVTGSGDLNVLPRFSTDNRTLYLDFVSANFGRITSVSYSVSYIADPQVSRMVKGSFSPATESISGESNGVPFIRKNVTLGTCSGTNCTYDLNPRGYSVKVVVRTNNGVNAYLLTLTLTDESSQDLSL